MQAIWSRAAQARPSCSCRSCFHTATNIARRTTTAAPKRRIKASDVFTACYSTILATAAVADMRVKEERLKEWDRVIAEAKAGIPQEPRDSGADNRDPSSQRAQRKKRKKPDPKPNFHHYYPVPIGDGLDTLTDYRLKQQSYQLELNPEYVEEEFDPELFTRQPKKPIHLEKQEESAARLVDRLLKESKLFSDRAPCANPEIQQEMEQMRSLIQSLMEGDTNLPLYEWNDIHEIADQREALSRSIQALCRKATKDDRASIDLMLTKVSYNFLVARAPPCTTNLNVLLAEFIRLKQPELSQIVVCHFIHDSKHKPTKVTVKLILDHYIHKGKRGKGDPASFRSIVQRMRGTRDAQAKRRPDMLVKHRDVSTLHWPEHEEWVLTTKTIRRNGNMHQKMPRDAPVFDSLILGHLKFQGPQGAVRMIRSCFREGHLVNHETLVVVITACLEQLNFSSGLQLIRVFLNLWRDGVGFIATVYTEQFRHLFRQLLLMCGFDTALKSTADLPIKHCWDSMQDMLHFMAVEDIQEAVDRISDLTFSLSQCLGLISSDTSTEPAFQGETALSDELPQPAPQREFRTGEPLDVDRALQVLDDYDAEELDREFLRNEIETSSRWRRILTLEDRVDRRCEQTASIEAEIFSLVRSYFPEETMKRFDAVVSQLSSYISVPLSATDKFHVLRILPDVEEVLCDEGADVKVRRLRVARSLKPRIAARPVTARKAPGDLDRQEYGLNPIPSSKPAHEHASCSVPLLVNMDNEIPRLQAVGA